MDIHTRNTRRDFIAQAAKMGTMGMLAMAFSGCKTLESVTNVGATLAEATGTISSSQASSIRRSGKAVAKSFEDFTPEQEYYIGRAVGAAVVKQYRPYTGRKENQYVNVMGRLLALASDMPETYGGYHFQILDSDEINAFAAPGGLVFVTRGILRCCRNEDAAAAILAHEIAHVVHKHGLQSIKKSRITNALTVIGTESVKQFADDDIAALTNIFEDSISDITNTLINNGYSRSFERNADETAVHILKRVGYQPGAIVDMLFEMDKRLKPGGMDFAKTHPSPKSRIKEISKKFGNLPKGKGHPKRNARFRANLGRI